MLLIDGIQQCQSLPFMSWPGDLWGEIVSFAIQQYPHSKTYIPFLQEWWRFDSEAPWRLPANRPGPSPFKAGGSPFHIIPGGTSPERIRPDIVHTFHLGFGVDMAASIIVWLCHLGFFGDGRPRQSFEEKLSYAYSAFREYCHETKRFTACDHWTTKKIIHGIEPRLLQINFWVSSWKLFDLCDFHLLNK